MPAPYGHVGPASVAVGSVASVLGGALDGWLASNDANNAATSNPAEAPDKLLTQANVYKGLLVGLGLIGMVATGGRTFPVVGSALTARQAAFHVAQKGRPTPLPAQG